MHKYVVLVGLLLLTAGSALAQSEFPKVEASGDFMYVRTGVVGRSTNCAGGGGTLAYNVTSSLGLAADLGYCRFFGNTFTSGNKVDGSLFTYLFGPRITLRNHTPLTPFFDLNFGATRIGVSCNSSNLSCLNRTNAATLSQNAFAMTVGGGFDIRINNHVSLRAIQAEYLYTRFANGCLLAVCSNNNQNSFRLKSGIVFGFGNH